ncbi:MAG: hypothetical protein HYV60_08310 [Planctomycetia bacterium]|nr:hypothetical protein [Planctomycetia bacterium]
MLSNPWLKTTSAILLAGLLILGPAKLLTEMKVTRGLISDLYDSLRSDEHLVASMREQLESQHRKIALLATQHKKGERQIRAEQARIVADEKRLEILRSELGMAQLHLRSASETFQVSQRTLTREQLSSHADHWLAEAIALEKRLPQLRDSLAAITAGQQTLQRQMADARQAWNERVRDLESQASRLESAQTQLAMAEVLREAQAADLVFQSEYANDQDQLEERIDLALAEADFMMGTSGPSEELVFHRSPDAVADRISNFLDEPPANLMVTSE